jgi:hypothetical protein
MELKVNEIGPSLKWASAKLERVRQVSRAPVVLTVTTMILLSGVHIVGLAGPSPVSPATTLTSEQNKKMRHGMYTIQETKVWLRRAGQHTIDHWECACGYEFTATVERGTSV